MGDMELNPAYVNDPSNTPTPKPKNVKCFTLLGLIAGLIIGLLTGILIGYFLICSSCSVAGGGKYLGACLGSV